MEWNGKEIYEKIETQKKIDEVQEALEQQAEQQSRRLQ